MQHSHVCPYCGQDDDHGRTWTCDRTDCPPTQAYLKCPTCWRRSYTGRTTSSPEVQGMPIPAQGVSPRAAFMGRRRRFYVETDFSQVEIRLAAQDPRPSDGYHL